MKKSIISLSILFLLANITIAQNYRDYNVTKNIFNETNGTFLLRTSLNKSNAELSDYFVKAQLDSASTNSYVYSTPIDIYKNSLLVKRINNISGIASTPYYTRDNIDRGNLEPAIEEYFYNQSGNLSEIQESSFKDNGERYLRGKEIYTYINNKLDNILFYKLYTDSDSLKPYAVNDFQYNQDSVISFNGVFLPNGDKSYSTKTKSVYSNGLINIEEFYSYNQGTQSWDKYYISNYYYNIDNSIDRIESQRIDYFSGDTVSEGVWKYIYNPDKTLKQNILSSSTYNYSISYTYGTDNVISILAPKDGRQFEWSNNDINFSFFSYDSSNINLFQSTDNGNTWQSVVNNISSNQIYSWTIPNTTQQDYLFKAVDINDSNVYDIVYLNIYEKAIIYQAAHNTGSLQLQVDNKGSFGNFNFKGNSNVLSTGGFAVSSKSIPFKGSFYFSPIIYDFTNSENMYELSSNSNFDQISNCSFIENNMEIGISVNQKTFSETGDDFVLIRYKIKNISSTRIDSLVIGNFMDLDIPNYSSNLGGVDSSKNLLYQYSSNDSSYYYGIVAMQNVYGANVTSQYDNYNLKESFHDNFTTVGMKNLTSPDDYRSFISSGPYSLEVNEGIELGFAIAAGKDLEDFLNNTELAKQKYELTVVSVKENKTIPNLFSLSQNYPNPFNPTTKISYSIPHTITATLKVYDVLGREITTLVNGEKSAGNYEVDFDASKLASGIYIYQLRAGNFTSSKKMLLLK